MKRSAAKVAAALSLVAGLALNGASVVTSAWAGNSHQLRTCTNASLNGSFGFYRTGNTPDGTLAALGLLVFDGNGNLTGSQSISRGGEYDFDIPISAYYRIATDCTGVGLSPDGVEFFRLVVVDGGDGFYIFSESPGNGVYGVGRRTGFPP
jgi:hypothetical protein